MLSKYQSNARADKVKSRIESGVAAANIQGDGGGEKLGENAERRASLGTVMRKESKASMIGDGRGAGVRSQTGEEKDGGRAILAIMRSLARPHSVILVHSGVYKPRGVLSAWFERTTERAWVPIPVDVSNRTFCL